MPKVPELLSATVHLLLTAYSCIQAFPVFGGWPRVKRSHGNPGHIKWSCNYECLPRDLSAWWRSCSSPLSTRLSLPFRLPVRRSARRPRSHTHTHAFHTTDEHLAGSRLIIWHGGLDKRDNNESRGRFEPIPPMPPIYNRGSDVTSSTCSHSWSSDVYASLLTFLPILYFPLSSSSLCSRTKDSWKNFCNFSKNYSNHFKPPIQNHIYVYLLFVFFVHFFF